MKRIFVNGSFDLLHSAHIELLNTAKSHGDYLMVAIDTDARIAEKKGVDRPINNQYTRTVILSNLKAVDEVKTFGTDDELVEIIKDYAPDIMMVGSDWRDKEVIGQEYAKTLKFFERIANVSTTNTLENYVNRRQLHGLLSVWSSAKDQPRGTCTGF